MATLLIVIIRAYAKVLQEQAKADPSSFPYGKYPVSYGGSLAASRKPTERKGISLSSHCSLAFDIQRHHAIVPRDKAGASGLAALGKPGLLNPSRLVVITVWQ